MAPAVEAARRRRADDGGAPAPRCGGAAGVGVEGKEELLGKGLMKRLFRRTSFPVGGCEKGDGR